MQTQAIDGELTIFTAAEMKPLLLDFLKTEDDLEISLANVTEIDTAGLQLLILLKRESARAGKTLRYVMHNEMVLDLLELANLTGSFGDPVVLAHNKE